MFNPAWASAIGQIESSNNYGQVTDSGKGRRALGKYQVMDFNVAPWTREVLGREMTPDEFLANKTAQDTVFEKKFGGFADKYGSPQEAASVWFSGRPMAVAGNASDRFGTTVPSYVSKFNKAMGQGSGVNAIEAAMGGDNSGGGQAMAFAPNERPGVTPPPDNGFMGQIGGFLNSLNYANPKTGYDTADALSGAGASMMALDNPSGGLVLSRLQQQNQKTAAKQNSEYQYDPKSGTFFRTRADGTLQTMQNPNAPDPEDKNKPKFDSKVLKNLSDHVEKYGAISQISDEGAKVLDNLQSGKLDLGMMQNLENSGRNMTGMDNEQSRAYADYKQFIQKLANTELLKAKGVQTEGDAYRVMQEIAAGGAGFNNNTAREAISKLLLRNKEAVTQNGRAVLDAYKGAYGDNEGLKPFTQQFDNFGKVYENIDKKLEGYKTQSSPSAPASGGFKVIKQH
jgi:hypothetical protein